MVETTRPQAQIAGIGLRLLAATYDFGLLFAVAFVLFIPLTLLEQSFGSMQEWIKQLLLLSICFAYFVGFWSKAGATTGMRPWKLRVAMIENGNTPSLGVAIVRFCGLILTWLALGMTLVYMAYRDTEHALFFIASAIPGLSLLCMMLTPKRQTLHDLLVGTSVYRVLEK